MNEVFRKFSGRVSAAVGSAHAFFVAIFVIIVWAITGPIFGFSDTWQLFINTGTTIVTFLMVFVIQNTQNRDARSMRLQLDELIESMQGASDKYLDLDSLSDAELDKLRDHFHRVHQRLEKHHQTRRDKSNK